MCASRRVDGLLAAAMSVATVVAGCSGGASAPEPATAAAAEPGPSAEELAQLEAQQLEARRIEVIEAWRRSALRRELCPPMPAELRDRRLAWNEHFEITLCEMATTLGKMSPTLRQMFQEPEKRRHLLDNRIRYELLVQEARRRGYADDEEVHRIRKQMMLQRLDEQVQESVRVDDITEEQMRIAEAERRGLGHDPEIMDQVERVMASLLVRHEVDERVTPEDIMDYQIHDDYQEHIDRYHRPERVRASHILISDGEQAQELLEKMRAASVDNEEFRRLALELSEDEETNHRGGDLRYFPRSEDRTEDDPEIPEHLVRAAFEMLEKQQAAAGISGASTVGISGALGAGRFDPLYPLLIKCDRGYHILRFTGHRGPVKRELEEVERQIRNRLWRENLKRAREQLTERLRDRDPVTIDEDALPLIDDALQALEQPPAPTDDEAP